MGGNITVKERCALIGTSKASSKPSGTSAGIRATNALTINDGAAKGDGYSFGIKADTSLKMTSGVLHAAGNENAIAPAIQNGCTLPAAYMWRQSEQGEWYTTPYHAAPDFRNCKYLDITPAEVPDPPRPDPRPQRENGTLIETYSVQTAAPTATPTPAPTAEIPKTGDDATACGFVMLAAAALVAVLATKRRTDGGK